MIRNVLPATILLLILMLISIFPIRGANARPPELSQIRLGIGHSGIMLATADDLPPDIAAKIPANVEPATVLGGERFPVNVRLIINGETVVE